MDIQNTKLEILGLGGGKKKFENEIGETFFIIVKSEKLLRIRNVIFQKYLSNGGDATKFNPLLFYPHITVGYTHKDIHYPELIKDVEHSLDERFKLMTKRRSVTEMNGPEIQHKHSR